MIVYFYAGSKRYHADRQCWALADQLTPVFHAQTLGKVAEPITVGLADHEDVGCDGKLRTLTPCRVCVTKEWGSSAPPIRYDKGQTFQGGAETFR